MSTAVSMRRFLRRLGILTRSVVAAGIFAFSSKRQVLQNPRTIVVVQTAQLGDMVCTTPVFRAIKKHLPETKLVVVGSKGGEGILENSVDVDEYIVFNEKHPEKTARILRAEKIDTGILMVPSLDGLLLLANARIQSIVAPELQGGFSPANTKLYRLLSKFVVRKPHIFGNYAPREYLKLLEPLGIVEDDTTKHLAYSEDARKHVDEFLQNCKVDFSKGYVCIAPGAGNKVKQWPPERFAGVAEYIGNTYQLPILLIGSPNDLEEVTATRAAIVKDTVYVDTCGKFSLDEVKALISGAHLLIAGDTMVIYIAEAFNTNLIDIVGPVDEHEQPPTGEGRIVVVPPGERVPQMHIMNARVYNLEEVRRQATATTVQMVTAAVDTLLQASHEV